MSRTIMLALSAAALAAGSASAQSARPEAGYGYGDQPSAPVDASASNGALTGEATHEAVARWLADNAPSSRGHEVFVSGDEAFWYEHQDRDAKAPMHVVATIHTETFGDASAPFRSSYQLVDFDCEHQTQKRIYLRRYQGADLTGEVRKETHLLNLAQFVSPIDPDYAHLRTVCLPVYDEIRRRTYAITVPGR